jgi:hypothetical protein
MAPERRTQLLLAALVVVLLVVVATMYRGGSVSPTAVGRGPASNVRRQGTAPAVAGAVTAPDVHLDALNSEHPEPDASNRNLFRFQPKAPPPRPVAPPSQPVQPPPARPSAPQQPSNPPISLKFVGFIETEQRQKIASLSDGRGVVIGKEGDIVLGRYKIWRIGEESIEVSYLDGTGRATIRLTGQ